MGMSADGWMVAHQTQLDLKGVGLALEQLQVKPARHDLAARWPDKEHSVRPDPVELLGCGGAIVEMLQIDNLQLHGRVMSGSVPVKMALDPSSHKCQRLRDRGGIFASGLGQRGSSPTTSSNGFGDPLNQMAGV